MMLKIKLRAADFTSRISCMLHKLHCGAFISSINPKLLKGKHVIDLNRAISVGIIIHLMSSCLPSFLLGPTSQLSFQLTVLICFRSVSQIPHCEITVSACLICVTLLHSWYLYVWDFPKDRWPPATTGYSVMQEIEKRGGPDLQPIVFIKPCLQTEK